MVNLGGGHSDVTKKLKAIVAQCWNNPSIAGGGDE